MADDIRQRDLVQKAGSPQVGPSGNIIEGFNSSALKAAGNVIKDSAARSQKEKTALEKMKEKMFLTRRAELQNELDDSKNRAEAKILNSNGINAIKVYDEATAEYKKESQESFDEFPDEWKNRVRAMPDNTFNSLNKVGINYVHKENQETTKNIFKVRGTNIAKEVSLRGRDLEGFGLALGMFDDLYEDIALVDGLSNEEKKLKISNSRSKATLDSIENLISLGDHEGAVSLFEKYKVELANPDNFDTASKALVVSGKQNEKTIALEAVNKALEATGNDFAAARKLGEKITNGNVYTSFISILNEKNSAMKAQLKEDDANTLKAHFEQVREAIATNQDPYAVGRSAEPKHKAAINKFIKAEREGGKADHAEVIRLYGLYQNDRAAFIKEDIEAVAHLLTPSRVKEFQGLQTAAVNKNVSDATSLKDKAYSRFRSLTDLKIASRGWNKVDDPEIYADMVTEHLRVGRSVLANNPDIKDITKLEELFVKEYAASTVKYLAVQRGIVGTLQNTAARLLGFGSSDLVDENLVTTEEQERVKVENQAELRERVKEGENIQEIGKASPVLVRRIRERIANKRYKGDTSKVTKEETQRTLNNYLIRRGKIEDE
jgi:hypothetical protein